MKPIPFVDLQAQRIRLGSALNESMARVLERGDFILGEEVRALEAALAEYCLAGHVVSCANGTDALTLVGLAEGLGPGDVVFVPSFTFVGSAEAFALLGVTPFFVDVDAHTFNMCPQSLQRSIHEARSLDFTPRMIVAVDLFGQPADYNEIARIADSEDLILLADAAQSFGAMYHNRRVGGLADYTTTSFFPAKPFGCYGDGGAVMTNDSEKATLIESLRFHGKGTEKYDNVRIGLNSRLDTLQAAVLLEKLKIFDEEMAARNGLAHSYGMALENVAETPRTEEGITSSWAQYTLKTKNRDQVQSRLKEKGVPSAVYYPLPLHQQDGYRAFPHDPEGLPVSESLPREVLSLPIHAYIDAPTQDYIIQSFLEATDNPG